MEQRLLAVTLTGGRGSAVSHEAAAILDDCEDWKDRFHRPVHLSVPDDRQPSLVRASFHRPYLPSDHVGVVDGIPCTTFARTLIDLSGRASLGQVARAHDHGLVHDLVSLRELARCLLVLPGAPGRRPRLVRGPGRASRPRVPGLDAHRTRSAFDRDFRRDRVLGAGRAGWTIVDFTSVCTDAEIARDVREALRRLARRASGLVRVDR